MCIVCAVQSEWFTFLNVYSNNITSIYCDGETSKSKSNVKFLEWLIFEPRDHLGHGTYSIFHCEYKFNMFSIHQTTKHRKKKKNIVQFNYSLDTEKNSLKIENNRSCQLNMLDISKMAWKFFCYSVSLQMYQFLICFLVMFWLLSAILLWET